MSFKNSTMESTCNSRLRSPHLANLGQLLTFNFQKPLIENRCLRRSAESEEAFVNLLWGKILSTSIRHECRLFSHATNIVIYMFSQHLLSNKKERMVGRQWEETQKNEEVYSGLKSSRHTPLRPYKLYTYVSIYFHRSWLVVVVQVSALLASDPAGKRVAQALQWANASCSSDPLPIASPGCVSTCSQLVLSCSHP